MRLAFPTLAIVLYICVSLIWRLPCRPWLKMAAGCALVAVGSKYIIYEKIGGSFIAPDFPPALLLTMEFLYSAMVLLAFLLLVRDALALLLLVSRWLGSSWHLPFTPAKQAAGLLGAAFVLALVGSWQATRVPEVRTVEIALPGLPAELDGLSLVQLTDLHVGLLLKGPWLEEVVRKTNALNPDLIVLTGDMVDGSPEALAHDIAPLRNLHARYGVYGITGNHEYYFGVRQWLPVFGQLGIVMLQNDYRALAIRGTTLVLAGVPDQAALRFGEPGPEYGFLQTLPQGVRVLLQHRPAGAPATNRADLQLSGHTHGGHLFFLKWLIASYNGGLVGGLFDVNGGKLYVSPGTGVWAGFSCRLGVPSEITRIVLRRG
ncbi:metallophosphoesterase [Desulfobulbus sp.]|uniref:metallophosphoesterase n=1 Tax=Desulfobulbus sp. TaxID=895 RepID=UPI00286EFECF|nr:metallophosphoesterase [Desulfobulbus sp.]